MAKASLLQVLASIAAPARPLDNSQQLNVNLLVERKMAA
jgi:hypothetical protein